MKFCLPSWRHSSGRSMSLSPRNSRSIRRMLHATQKWKPTLITTACVSCFDETKIESDETLSLDVPAQPSAEPSGDAGNAGITEAPTVAKKEPELLCVPSTSACKARKGVVIARHQCSSQHCWIHLCGARESYEGEYRPSPTKELRRSPTFEILRQWATQSLLDDRESNFAQTMQSLSVRLWYPIW